MILNVVNWLSGTVAITVESGFPERVLNLCSAHGIAFWDTKWHSPTSFSMKLSRTHYLKLRRLSRKLDCEITVEKKEGAPFFVKKFRRRYALLIGLFCALSVVLVGSFFVWDFEIEGNETVSDERIMRALEKNGVTYGTFGLGIHPEQLKNHMLLEIPELSWMTVNVNGFRATVIVRERVEAPEIRDETTKANIVAEKDGLVTLVQLYGGHAEVMKGSTVTEGQLLISGVADIGDRGAYFTRGEGKVWARTWYDLTARVGKTVQEKAYTGKEKRAFTLILGKQRIKITPGSSIFDTNYDKITKNVRLRLPGGVGTPVVLECVRMREYEISPRTLDAEEAQQRAEDALLRQLSDRMGEDGTVKDTTFSVQEAGDAFEITLHAECEEQIGKTVEYME